MGRRNDGIAVLCCDACGLGVVETMPDDLEAYYRDSYYGNERTGLDVGYGDYQLTAEHAVSWAAAMVQLLKPAGRILDIGCVDGTLLCKLPSSFEKYGIEMNEAMAARAATRGIRMLGRDLLTPDIARDHRGTFDIVTSIAVFEHLSDLRAGMRVSLDLLKPDGILLFEVPYISALHENRVWFESSLEHVFYPSRDSMARLIEDLGACHVGGEVFIRDYGSNYIGIAFHDRRMTKRLQRLFAALTSITGTLPVPAEARVRQLLMLIHAAHSTPDLLADLSLLPATPPLMHRIEQLWSNDLRRLAHVTATRAISQPRLSRIKSAEALMKTAAALQLRREQDRAGILQKQQLASQDEAAALRAHIAHVDNELAALRARIEYMNRSLSWRVTAPLRTLGLRAPWLMLLIRRSLRLLRWTVRLELPSRLREVRASRQARKVARAAPEPSPPVQPGVPPATPVMPTLAFSERTGIAEPLSDDDTLDPWPANRPLVSVVVTSFNYGRFVADAVDSVLAQTFGDLEIIVVEGGSTDPESRRQTLALERPRTRIIAQERPTLVGANRNFGVSQARGKYVCCLDADDILAPTYIEKAVFLLEACGYDAVSSAMRTFGDSDERVDILESPTLADMLYGNNMLTCAVFRRSFWRNAGGFRDADPDRMGFIYEDWLLWASMAALGARLHNMAHDYLFLYRQHGPSQSRRTAEMYPLEVHRALINQAVSHLNGSASPTVTLTAPPTGLPASLLRPSPDGRKPVVLLALPFTIIGGAERLLSRIVSHLAGIGWRVIITTSIDPGTVHGDTTEWFEAATKEIFHLPRFLAQERWPDFIRYVILSHAVDVLWIVGSAFMYEQLPFICGEFPDLRVVDLLFNTIGHTANNRAFASLIDLTFAENQEVLRFLRDAGETDARLALVNSGIDVRAYQPGPRDPAVLDIVGATQSELIVGFSGRWSEEKDPLAFVEIARRSRDLPIRFVMTGAGAMRGDIEAAIRLADPTEERFCLAGEVRDIQPWLRSYDVLILPSRLDGRPVVVMEALALGVPVIASRVGALPEIITDGVNGFLAEPGDVDAFVQHLRWIVRNPEQLVILKQQARTYAEEKLDVNAMLASYEDRLLWVLRPEVRG
jgi:glycosyltransferase involved in cell wall biosynthesis/SAM-dependent methyltransferase